MEICWHIPQWIGLLVRWLDSFPSWTNCCTTNDYEKPSGRYSFYVLLKFKGHYQIRKNLSAGTHSTQNIKETHFVQDGWWKKKRLAGGRTHCQHQPSIFSTIVVYLSLLLFSSQWPFIYLDVLPTIFIITFLPYQKIYKLLLLFHSLNRSN